MKTGDTINNKYVIIDELGEGGMGKVFRVKNNNTEYALKICSDKNEESIKRFEREVRLMASVNHINVIEVLDTDFEYSEPYFVMPLCKYSIEKKINKLKDDPEVAIQILLQVCKGIGALHLSGIVHRDIKPKNILVSKENVIKISDLGLGKFELRDSSILTDSHAYMGTQGYIPPEFYKVGGTKNATYQSDIYQLGKTIYNVFTDLNPTLIEKDILPGGLLFIIRKCIIENIDSRYKTVGELENALSNYLLSLDPTSNPFNAFNNLINAAKNNLKAGEYDEQNLEEIIKSLFAFKDEPELFFTNVNKIPIKLLYILSSNLSSLCNEFLEIYIPTVDRYLKETRIDFSDAELIANVMYAVFKETKDIDIKLQTMQMTLFASVFCHRYDAMEKFDIMLQSIRIDKEASTISQMLRDRMSEYEVVADRVSSSKLHPEIQAVQWEARQKNQPEADKQIDLDDY